MIAVAYTEQHYQVLSLIPVFSGSARVVDLLYGFDAMTVAELTAMLELLIADGLVDRLPQKRGETYRVSQFGKLVVKAERQSDAMWSSVWFGTEWYELLIYSVPKAIRAPFVCWRVRSGTFLQEGGAHNERLAWQEIRFVLEQVARGQEVQAW